MGVTGTCKGKVWVHVHIHVHIAHLLLGACGMGRIKLRRQSRHIIQHGLFHRLHALQATRVPALPQAKILAILRNPRPSISIACLNGFLGIF
jgi:hypothetical protein